MSEKNYIPKIINLIPFSLGGGIVRMESVGRMVAKEDGKLDRQKTTYILFVYFFPEVLGSLEADPAPSGGPDSEE